MKHSISFIISFGWLLLASFDAHACAGCRNPNIPMTRIEGAYLSQYELRTGLSIGGSKVAISHEAGCADKDNCHETPVQPLYMHNQGILSGEMRATGEFGLTNNWGLELQAPLRFVNTTIGYTTPDGKSYRPLDTDVHHRHETLVRPGDPWLLFRWATNFGSLSLSVRAGATVPFGSTEPNPFTLGDSGIEHQHIQFGSGTVDPLLLIDVSKPLGLWLVSAYGQAQTTVYENSYGFMAGTKVSGGLQVGRRLWRGLSGGFGTEVAHEETERWSGIIYKDGNLGRTELLLALSLIQSFKSFNIGVSMRVPYYQHITKGEDSPGSISTPVNIGVFANRSFQLM